MNTAPIDIGQQIAAAQSYSRSVEHTNVRHHYLWEVEQLTTTVTLGDLTTEELIALTALLVPAHSRVLARESRPPVPLRLIPRHKG